LSRSVRYGAAVFTLEDVEAALRGDDSGLVRAAGPGAIVRVDGEQASVLVTRGESGEVVFGRSRADGGAIDTVALPEGFHVREVAVEDGKFVLTGVNGRVMRGSADKFTTGRGILVEPPHATVELSNETEIAQAGETIVTIGGEQVWVRFDDAKPEQVRALLPRARELLASFAEMGRRAVEYLWPAFESDQGIDEDRFFAEMVPTYVELHQNGEFDLHFGVASGVFYLDGYWPSVQFTATNTPVGFTTEG
jgi:hypothetical protein